MFGGRSSQVATLVERQTRYVMLVKVAGQDTQTVVNALQERAQTASRTLQVSDLGPGQGDGGSQANGLLRQYLPKDISSYSQAKLNAVARQLNERPRKTLGYQTPADMFNHTVASTG